jgi:peptidoglycan/LPS O-acetylase OafA/YrhL
MLATQTKSVSSPEQPTIGKNLRSEGLDFARGIAILMVIVLHAMALTPGLYDFDLARLISARMGSGVQLFFVLSGFLICRSWERSRLNGDAKFGFYIRRISKIAPLYYVFIALNIIIFISENNFNNNIVIRNSINEENFLLNNIFVHLLFLQGFFPKWLHSLSDGSWSIVCEIYFYALAPYILNRFNSTYRALWLFAFSLIISVLFVTFVGRHFSEYSFYGFPSQFPCFVLGIICYYVDRDDVLRAKVARGAVPIAAIGAIILMSSLQVASKPLPESILPGVCGAAIVLTAPSIFKFFPDLVRAGMVQMGRQSYALFFAHMTLLKLTLIGLAFFGYSAPLPVHLLINLLVGIFGSLIFSQLIFDPIDRACVGAASSWLKKRAQKLGEIK